MMEVATLVRDVMTTDVKTVTPAFSVMEATQKMNKFEIGSSLWFKGRGLWKS